ncbi:DUF6265 family protein [Sphingobacterium lumbrici]|uniref:DUF6265 family protein n=1 Tax=Sphingobacterium lumbrici TaxID=2559600 RepID=UPI00112A26E3|nr:DUF6265 family protein [Sphingobacterium lumbrici]
MKYLLVFLTMLLTQQSISQTISPDFMEGTWKRKDKNHYEHWDKLNPRMLKGFSYMLKNGNITVTEYATIHQTRGKEVVYSATVKGQNAGKTINFKQTLSDTALIFENQAHDFPKKIVYKKRTDSEILVQISDGGQKIYSYSLLKQHTKNTAIDSTNANPNYNAALAQKLGADDYGMKKYFLVILKTGNNTTDDKEFINSAFRGHLDNIDKLVEQGKLILAGPLGKNERTYRGIFVLNVTSPDEADEVLMTDPAIRANLLTYELFNWYGSAALPEYLPSADKVWKLSP